MFAFFLKYSMRLIADQLALSVNNDPFRHISTCSFHPSDLPPDLRRGFQDDVFRDVKIIASSFTWLFKVSDGLQIYSPSPYGKIPGHDFTFISCSQHQAIMAGGYIVKCSHSQSGLRFNLAIPAASPSSGIASVIVSSADHRPDPNHYFVRQLRSATNSHG